MAPASPCCCPIHPSRTERAEPTARSDDRGIGAGPPRGQGGAIHGPDLPDLPLSTHAQALLVSLLGRDRLTAQLIVANALGSAARETVYRDVVASALADVGRLWERRELTSDDHAAAVAITADALAHVALDPLSHHDDTDAAYAIVSVVDADTHVLGAQVLADCLRSRGWAVTVLGRTSPDALTGFCAALEPRLVAISGAVIGHRPLVCSAVEGLAALESRPRVLAGGQMTLGGTRRELGADAMTGTLEDGLDWADRIR